MLYATHLRELGDVAIVNGDTAGDSLAASLVAGSETIAAADGEPSVRPGTMPAGPAPATRATWRRQIELNRIPRHAEGAAGVNENVPFIDLVLDKRWSLPRARPAER